MAASLKCPNCLTRFKNVVIENGAVRCPECKAAMFIYRKPDEDITPKEFTKLLETRGKEAALTAIHWFKLAGMNKAQATFAAGKLIMFIWPHLAQTFVVDEEKLS